MKKFKIITPILIIVIAVCCVYMYMNLDKPYKGGADSAVVKVEQGSSTGDIAHNLHEKRVIGSEFKFKLLSKIKGYDGKYKAGSYKVSCKQRPSEIAQVIMSGVSNGRQVTVPEGYNVKQIAKLMDKEKVCTEADFLAACETGNFDYKFLDKNVKGPERVEGFLYPATYPIEDDMTAEDVVRAMLDEFNQKFTEDDYKTAKKMNMTVEQIVTVASIVEREAVKPEERAKVASVIYNRLDKGMNLQMCSTIQYILGSQKEILTNEDTSIPSPYNTYLNGGLPPTPIACPGIDSINAALHPAKTDYLYFVVSDKLDGSMKFSTDYDEFLKNKDAYYDALRKEGKS